MEISTTAAVCRVFRYSIPTRRCIIYTRYVLVLSSLVSSGIINPNADEISARVSVCTLGRPGFNLIIMGAPGGGKGTISKKLVADFKFKHLSTGDLLRSHVSRGTELGKEAEGFMRKGHLVPDSVVLGMISGAYSSLKECNILLDGFPRTLLQAKELAPIIPIDSVIFLDIPHSTIIDRLSARWVHAPSGRTYAYDYNPPKRLGFDDETGEPLSQRDDDKPETIRTRLEAFDRQTLPLFSYYEGCHLPVGAKRFPGTLSDVIYRDVKSYLYPHLA